MTSCGDSSIFNELNRRAKFDHDNLKRSPAEQSAAWETEQGRRANWNAGNASADSSHDGHVVSNTQSGNTNADQAAVDTYAMAPNGSSSAAGGGKSFWDDCDDGDGD